MSRAIRRTKQVRSDVIDIYRYVRERNASAAEKVYDAIQQSIRGLLDTPGTGRHWNSPDPRLKGMRVTTVRPYRSYLIFFRSTPRGIDVFRIVHGARELQPLVDEIQLDFEEP